MKPAKEEWVIILDFLPHGYHTDTRPMHMKTPIAQAVGREHFILLELVPKKGIFLQPNEEAYMGEGKRDKIHHIIGKITYDKLTETARMNLEQKIHELVKKNEQRFVSFFNTAQPMNTRVHQMELLPGIGKKHMWQIIEEREKSQFKDFADIKSRVKLLPEPEGLVVKRILNEMKGQEKYKIFVGA